MKPTLSINVSLTKEQAIILATAICKYSCYIRLSEEEEWLKELMDSLVSLLDLNAKVIANAAAFDIFVRNPEAFTVTLEGQKNNS